MPDTRAARGTPASGRTASTAAGGARPSPGQAVTPGRVVRPGAGARTVGASASKGHHGNSQDSSFRHSYSKDRAQLLRRLSRIEGQVRGIARMIERDEYCIDILQQTSALRAAVDAVAVMVLEDHVRGCVRTAAERGEADVYADEVLDVVRRTLGRPVRTPGRNA